MISAITNYFIVAIGFFAALIAIYRFTKQVSDTISNDAVVAMYALSFFAIYYFIISLWRTGKWYQHRNYGAILSIINSGFLEIHSINREKDSNENTELRSYKYKKTCESMCCKISTAFSTITSKPCHVSIKYLSQLNEDGPLFIATLARSTPDRQYDNNNVIHWVDSNTDFREIFVNIGNDEGKYFFCNNLPNYIGYQNSSFLNYSKNSGYYKFSRSKWPLPYRSTIVVPIYPNLGGVEEDKLIGFLCVDSASKGAFQKDYDVDIMRGVANGIYDIVYKMVNSLNESDSEEN